MVLPQNVEIIISGNLKKTKNGQDHLKNILN